MAAFIYKRKHTLKGAITGLIVGCLSATAVMLLWNFLITPIYMGVPGQLSPPCWYRCSCPSTWASTS